MYPFWLLATVLELVASSIINPAVFDFADPPPLPTEGVRLYPGILNRTIPNYAMIAARDFSDRDGGTGPDETGRLDGLNDGLWCQSGSGAENIGSWMLPNGSVVPDDLHAKPINMAHNRSQVGLLRNGSIGISPYQGMYTCTIPDDNGVMQTLVVWAAGNAAYDAVSNPVVAEALFIPSSKPRDTDPPEFILSIDVMVAPPTHVTCQVGSTPVEVAVLSREVTAGEYLPPSTASLVTSVNVTLRTRQAGNYTCTVSVYRASGDNLSDTTTSSISISVTGTPIAVSAVQVGPNTIQLSWSPPASNTPPVAGYEVFYVIFGNYTAQSGGITTNTAITVTLPIVGIMYDFFVVAFSDTPNTLPSAHSNTINIELEITYSTPQGDTVTNDSTTPTATPNTPALDVTTTTSEDSDSSANFGSVIGAFSGVLVILVIIIIILGIMLLVSVRHGGFLLKNANGSQSLGHAVLNFSKFPWKVKDKSKVRKNEQPHIVSETANKHPTGVETPGNVPPDSLDLYHALEGDHTYSNVDDMELDVVVLSSNPAYSKHDHTHPGFELNQFRENGQGAGEGSIFTKTATAK